MDMTGFLWPCSACTTKGSINSSHIMYCPRSKVFGDNKCQLKDDPADDKCIPEDYKNTYASFNLAYISFMVIHVVKLVTQKRLGCPFKLQDVHKSAYMSAHLAKNKIHTQLENDGYIGSKVIEKGTIML